MNWEIMLAKFDWKFVLYNCMKQKNSLKTHLRLFRTWIYNDYEIAQLYTGVKKFWQ